MSEVDRLAEIILKMVRDDEELEAIADADARIAAHALIQGYLGPDLQVVNIEEFFSALVQALKESRRAGRHDMRSL